MAITGTHVVSPWPGNSGAIAFTQSDNATSDLFIRLKGPARFFGLQVNTTTFTGGTSVQVELASSAAPGTAAAQFLNMGTAFAAINGTGWDTTVLATYQPTSASTFSEYLVLMPNVRLRFTWTGANTDWQGTIYWTAR